MPLEFIWNRAKDVFTYISKYKEDKEVIRDIKYTFSKLLNILDKEETLIVIRTESDGKCKVHYGLNGNVPNEDQSFCKENIDKIITWMVQKRLIKLFDENQQDHYKKAYKITNKIKLKKTFL